MGGGERQNKVLNFSNQGLLIELPVPASKVKMNLATFDSPLLIIAYDVEGNELTRGTVTADNLLYTLVLSAAGIKDVSITGGNDSGVLHQICMVVY
jgi:hypothetical protein